MDGAYAVAARVTPWPNVVYLGLTKEPKLLESLPPLSRMDDPDAVPLDEGEEGMTVSVYPSHPLPSFLSSGPQSLAAYPQNGACNTSCTPTILMSMPIT